MDKGRLRQEGGADLSKDAEFGKGAGDDEVFDGAGNKIDVKRDNMSDKDKKKKIKELEKKLKDHNKKACLEEEQMYEMMDLLEKLKLDAEKKTTVDDKNIKRMRIEHRYTKPRLPMPTDDDRITMLAEQIAVCRKELADLIASREDFEDQSTKVVKAVENHINLDLTVEKRARKDLEAKMLKYAEDLVGSLRADLEVEKRLRNEAQTTYQQTLEDILEISKNLDLETEARKQQ